MSLRRKGYVLLALFSLAAVLFLVGTLVHVWDSSLKDAPTDVDLRDIARGEETEDNRHFSSPEGESSDCPEPKTISESESADSLEDCPEGEIPYIGRGWAIGREPKA